MPSIFPYYIPIYCLILGIETTMHSIIENERLYGAHNYEPLPVVLTQGKGIYVWDDQGNR